MMDSQNFEWMRTGYVVLMRTRYWVRSAAICGEHLRREGQIYNNRCNGEQSAHYQRESGHQRRAYWLASILVYPHPGSGSDGQRQNQRWNITVC